MAEVAKDYEVTDKVLHIDGREFPWFVGTEGPKVEAVDEYHHWLWVPVIVMKPAPGMWDDRGEPLSEQETA